MARSQATLTTIDNTLKEDYGPEIAKAIRTSMPFMTRIKNKAAKKSKFGGKAFRMNIPLEIGRNWSVQHYNEDGSLPDADHIEYDNTQPTLASVDGAIKLTGHALDATEDNPRAYIGSLTSETRGMVKTMQMRLAIAYHGDGTGRIARANGAGSSATALVVDTPDNRWLDRNMYIDAYTGATKEIDGIRISNISSNGTTVTLATASTWSDNAWIYLKGENGPTIIQGLLGIVDDGNGTATLQGIGSRTSKSYWQGQLINGGGAAFSEDLVQQAIDQTERFGEGASIDILLCDHVTRRYVWNTVLTDKQRIVDSSEGVGGFKSLKFWIGNKIVELMADRMSYPGYLYGLDSSKFIAGWAPKIGGRWMDRGNGILKQESRKDNWLADYYCRHGLFVTNTINHFRLYNFAAPA